MSKEQFESSTNNNRADSKSLIPFISKEFKKHFTKDITALYHYTDLEGAQGIISNKTFWASHIKFMNDSKEYSHGLEICETIVQNLIQEFPKENPRRAYLEEVFTILEEQDTDIFVVSFCENEDLLSQWRGYSRSKHGVSIGFDYAALFDVSFHLSEENFFPRKVIYNHQLQQRVIHRIIEIALTSTESNTAKPAYTPKEVARTIGYFLPLFKHSTFSEEKEWRIIVTNSKSMPYQHELKFRARDNIILPYIELLTHNKVTQNDNKLPINQLTVGPSGTNEFTARSLNYYLKNVGYPTVPIKISYIPYR